MNHLHLETLSRAELQEILSEMTGLPESQYDCETVWTYYDLISEIRNVSEW